MHLQQFITNSSSPVTSRNTKASSHKLQHLERSLGSTDKALAALSSDHDDLALLEQHCEQLCDYKRELAAVYEDLVTLDLDEKDDLIILYAKLEKLQFESSHKVKKLISSQTSNPASTPVVGGKGVKLPKLDVPTFSGDVLHWKQFWEQFSVSVYDHSNLSDAKKLIYLQQAIKDGSARNTIEGLS